MKRCASCDKIKDVNAFHSDASKPDGRTSYCADCAKHKNKSHYAKNKSKRLATSKIYRQNNLDAIRKWNRDYKRQRKDLVKQIRELDVHARVKYLLAACKSRVKQFGHNFEIDVDDIIYMIIKQKYKCALTGIDFQFIFSRQYRTNPWAPSIDRIDNSKGYLIENIQIVCSVVNVAKSDYPTAIFDQMCIERAKVLGYAKA